MQHSRHLLILGDQSWPVESLAKTLPGKTDLSVFVEGKGWIFSNTALLKTDLKSKTRSCTSALKAVDDLFRKPTVSPKTTPRFTAIVGFEDTDLNQKVIERLKSQDERVNILELGSKGTRSFLKLKKRSVKWGDLIAEGFEHEMNLLELQERVRDMREALKDAGRIALLLQDDPDPDGLAAALGLRKLLGRKSQTATICTFGTVTRPENVAMARLLDIEIERVDLARLMRDFDKVVLVDCQPSFFKGRPIPVHAVFDHHPYSLTPEEEEILDFVEVREDLGSIATLTTLYLQTANVEVSQRMATALLYGIKSDTLMLNRQVSDLDLEAFVFLYPRINFSILRRIERPELPMGYLHALRAAMEHLKVKEGVCVLPMGVVEKEEWIPQAADFALQVEGTLWALGCGIFHNNVVISARVCGHQNHIGDIFKELFDCVGCAGGHRSMAKAIVSVDKWTETFGKNTLEAKEMARLLRKLLGPRVQQPVAH